MLQAPQFDGPSLDPFSLQQDGLAAPGVDICWGEVVQALVIALMVVVTDERIDLRFKVSGQEVVFQQDAVLQSLMLSLDLALGLRMMWGAPNMVHTVSIEIIRQIGGHI